MKDLIDIAIIITLTLTIVFISGNFLMKHSCKRIADRLNYQYEYETWTGCILIDSNKNKFLLEQLRTCEVNNQ